VKIVVPYAPGGSGDFSVRIVADHLRQSLGQAVIVENKVGAGGNIGNELVARSAPDGYTLLMATDGFGLVPHLDSKLTYNPIKDFAPIIQLTRQAVLLAVHPSAGVTTIAELVAASKRNKGMGYATSGAGTQQHMIGELFAKTTGASLIHIPYKGGGQAVIDFVGGQVPVAVLGTTPLMPHYKAGKIKVLAQSTPTRSPALRDVPTFEEAGVKGIVVEQWLGIVAPVGTPAPILARLNAEIGKVLADPSVRERYLQGALEPIGGSIEQFTKRIRDDYERYGKVVKEMNMKLQ
jgi:tripartite-type tricarboxylate transporter receptor subunit TctC